MSMPILTRAQMNSQAAAAQPSLLSATVSHKLGVFLPPGTWETLRAQLSSLQTAVASTEWLCSWRAQAEALAMRCTGAAQAGCAESIDNSIVGAESRRECVAAVLNSVTELIIHPLSVALRHLRSTGLGVACQRLDALVATASRLAERTAALRAADLKDLADSKAALAKAQQTTAGIAAELRAADESLAYLTHCREQDKAELARLRAENAEQEEQLRTAQAEAAEWQRQLASTHESLKARAAAEQDCRAEAQAVLCQLQSSVAALAGTLKALLEAVAANATRLVAQCASTDAAREAEKRELAAQVTALRDEQVRLAAEHAQACDRQHRAEDALAELQGDVAIKAKYIADLDAQLAKAIDTNRCFESELLQADVANKALRDRCASVTADLNTEIARLRKQFTRENAQLRLRIEELELGLIEPACTLAMHTENTGNAGQKQ